MKNQKGITLIALIITIIVLAILASVSINALTGQNGVVKEALKTSEEKEIADEEEEVKLAYSSTAMKNYGYGTTVDSLQTELNETVGIGKTEVTEENGKLKVKFVDTGRIYVAGDVYTGEDNVSTGGNWESIVANLKQNPNDYKPSSQTSNEYIGVGTDGKPVNMDLWYCHKTDDGQGMSLGKSHGDGEYSWGQNGYVAEVVDGKIQGKMPQYIYVVSENKVYPVISLQSTFINLDISEVPEIPTTVIKTSDGAFSHTGITSITIPDSVTSIGAYTFYSCNSLTNVVIPDSVTSIGTYTFNDCPVLTNIYYTGTQAQWNAISKGEYNTALNSATITYNYGK